MRNKIITFGHNIKVKDVKSVYYLITFISDFAVSTISATYVLFLLSQGLDLLQVNLVNLCFMTGVFIFEIPTGAYADYFGRKNSVILSNIFLILAFSLYFISSSLLTFIFAEILAALAMTFESGALDAWVADSLAQRSYTDKADFVFSHASMVGRAASLLGGLVGAYIGSVNLRLPLGLAAMLSLFALLTAIFLMQEDRITHKDPNAKTALWQVGKIAKEGISFGIRHKVILWLSFSSFIAVFAFQSLNMYWSPRFNMLSGNKIWILGWVWAGMCLFMILGGMLVKKLLSQKRSYFQILLITTGIVAAPIFLAASSNIFYIALSGFLFYEIGRGMFDPAQKSYLNQYAPSDKKATIFSFNSMTGRLGAALGLIVLGWVGKNYSIQTAWIISGCILLLLVPIFIKTAREENKLKQTQTR